MDPLQPIFQFVYQYLEPPYIKINVKESVGSISKWTIFTFMFISYFFFMSGKYFVLNIGIVYDMINEPPAIGSERDDKTGKLKPVAIMMYRLNGQYMVNTFF